MTILDAMKWLNNFPKSMIVEVLDTDSGEYTSPEGLLRVSQELPQPEEE